MWRGRRSRPRGRCRGAERNPDGGGGCGGDDRPGGALEGRVGGDETERLDVEGWIRPHDRLLLHQAEMQGPGG